MYGDEELLPMFAKLISMGDVEAGSMKRVMEAALDFSVVAGSLETAVDLLTKASVGYTSTLSRYGIIIDESIPKSQKFEAALKIIESRTYGMQKAMTETTEGAIKQMKNAFGDLAEEIGKTLAPTVTRISKNLKLLFEWLGKSETFLGIDRGLIAMQQNITSIETEIKRLQETQERGGVVGYGIWAMSVEQSTLQIQQLQIQLEKERAIYNQRRKQFADLAKLGAGALPPAAPGPPGAPKEWTSGLAGALPIWQRIEPEWLKGMEAYKRDIDEMEVKWVSFADQVEWSWTSTIEGMISGTMRFQEFAKRMFQDVLRSYLSMVSQMAAQELFGYTKELFRQLPGLGGGGAAAGTGEVTKGYPALSAAPAGGISIGNLTITGPDADRIVEIVRTNIKRKGVLSG